MTYSVMSVIVTGTISKIFLTLIAPPYIIPFSLLNGTYFIIVKFRRFKMDHFYSPYYAYALGVYVISNIYKAVMSIGNR